MEIIDIKTEELYQVKQIWPAHADHISGYKDSWLEEMFKNENVVVQRKYDGERMLIHFNGNNTYCTSRRTSKKTGRYMENQDKLLNLPKILNKSYTVIDCECYSNDWSSIVGILHSLPDRAHELQKTTPVKFACFDCLFYDGCDVRNLPYEKRLFLLQQVLDNFKDDRFHIVESTTVKTLDEAYQIASQQWNAGNEGVVVKSLAKTYYDKGAMLKIKRVETVDVVVYDYQLGHGKYNNTVGALLVGYYDPEYDRIVHISNVNCGTDEDRDYWFNLFSTTDEVKKVLEVKCQEITDKSLRHPVYIRIRDDKDYKECTKETIFKE